MSVQFHAPTPGYSLAMMGNLSTYHSCKLIEGVYSINCLKHPHNANFMKGWQKIRANAIELLG